MQREREVLRWGESSSAAALLFFISSWVLCLCRCTQRLSPRLRLVLVYVSSTSTILIIVLPLCLKSRRINWIHFGAEQSFFFLRGWILNLEGIWRFFQNSRACEGPAMANSCLETFSSVFVHFSICPPKYIHIFEPHAFKRMWINAKEEIVALKNKIETLKQEKWRKCALGSAGESLQLRCGTSWAGKSRRSRTTVNFYSLQFDSTQ